MSPSGMSAGRRARRRLIPPAFCSSTKPGPKPTWAKTNMTRTHGRCARGERLLAKALFGKWRPSPSWRRCDAIGSPRPGSSTPINGVSFRAYVE
jgi:hypothetical protein